MSRAAGIDRQALLASISIFQGLEPADLGLLLGITRTLELRAGEVLFHKGDPGKELYGVLDGQLRVSGEREDGEEVLFNRMEPGEVFGEIALLDSSPRSAMVAAEIDSLLLCLHRDDFLPFLDTHPRVAVRLAVVLAEHVRRLSSLMEETLFLGLPTRLALNLVALAREAGGASADGVSFDISLPESKLDELSGETAAQLRDQIREWEAEEIITVEHGVITVRDLEGLEELARFLIL
jgi:CRP-like cAMP-binding protein